MNPDLEDISYDDVADKVIDYGMYIRSDKLISMINREDIEYYAIAKTENHRGTLVLITKESNHAKF